MYADIELDANAIELEFQASLSHLEWFYRTVKRMSANTETEDYETIIEFKRNMIINDAELVDNLLKSTPLLSRKTLISKHPYVDNLEDELVQIKEEEAKVDEGATYPDSYFNYSNREDG